MPEQGNSAHIYRLNDGMFRLTFISTSPSGAQFLSELGDFTRWELDDWLKDRWLPTGVRPDKTLVLLCPTTFNKPRFPQLFQRSRRAIRAGVTLAKLLSMLPILAFGSRFGDITLNQ